MAERRKYKIPGDLDQLLYRGWMKEGKWTARLLNPHLKKLEEVVEIWGYFPDEWRHKNTDKWAWMTGTALMVWKCREALKSRQLKKAVRIFKAIQIRLEELDKKALQKQRAGARKGGQQTSEKSQATKVAVEKLLESDRRYSSAEIARKVGCSDSNVRRIKQNWKQTKNFPKAPVI